MPSFRRILKYTPAAVLGLLMTAWGVSLGSRLSVQVPIARSAGKCVVYRIGTLPSTVHFDRLEAESDLYLGGMSWTDAFEVETLRLKLLGLVHVQGVGPWKPELHTHVEVPIPVMITMLLPLAIGPFSSFRFRLWHYLAFTTLVAVELAYYLQWQE